MPEVLIFWQKEGRLHTLASNHGYQHLALPTLPDNPESYMQQRQENGPDAAGFLPENIWDILKTATQQHTLLCLDASLPDNWHKLAWEQLNWRGRKLGHTLHVVRHAKLAQVFSSAQPLKTLCWNLWPETTFDAVLSQQGQIEIKHKRQQIEQSLEQGEDMGHFGRLLILAHGSENEADYLLDEQGQPWSCRLPATLPHEVLIIACASYQGNIHPLVVECLKRGSEQVICGHGELNAGQMVSFLQNWFQSKRPALDRLRNLQQADETFGGARWLRYYGQVPVTQYDLWTWQFYYGQKKPSDLFNDDLKGKDEQHIRSYLSAIKQNIDQYWPLTLNWLLPAAAYWAEKYDHTLLDAFKKQQRQLSVQCHELICETAYSMASVHRRKGDYPKAVQALNQGIRHAREDKQKIKLFGALVNDCIDLNLPDSGQQLCDQLDLMLSDTEDDEQAFRLLDRKARLNLRQGEIDQALQNLKRKQTESSDERELAGLLYAASWFQHPSAEDYAKQVKQRLTLDSASIGLGNDNRAYLLRAFAVYQWRCQQDAALLDPYLDICLQRLGSQQDSGPFAMTLIYYGLVSGDTHGSVWKQAVNALELDKYWLELAVFHALAGQTKETERQLKQFWLMRQKALEKLTDLDEYDWQQVETQRKKCEQSVFLSKAPVRPEHLTQHGLLPL